MTGHRLHLSSLLQMEKSFPVICGVQSSFFPIMWALPGNFSRYLIHTLMTSLINTVVPQAPITALGIEVLPRSDPEIYFNSKVTVPLSPAEMRFPCWATILVLSYSFIVHSFVDGVVNMVEKN